MTVSTTDSVVEYISGGPDYPIPFRFLQSADIQAILVKQNGVTEVLYPGTQYTVIGEGSANGGTLTSSYAASFLATPGALLIISRVMEAVQPTDLRNQGKYLAETQETALDRLTMLIQQVLAFFSRALMRPVGKDYFDAESRAISNVGYPQLQADAANKQYVDDEVADEAAARQQADANLQAQITGSVPVEASAFSEISWHNQVIQNSVVIPANKNAWSFGPVMTIAPGQSVTVGAGSFYTIADGELHP